MAEPPHAGVAGHQLHPVDAAQPAGVQVGDAVVGVGEEHGHDEDEEEGGREEAEAQRALHGGRVGTAGAARLA